jgi:hypothetical protein
MLNLLECVKTAAPDCAVSPVSMTEKRLPLGRLERVSRFTVTRSLAGAGFHPPDDRAPDFRLIELFRALELIDTPDGPLRGRDIICAVKDGAAAVSVTYTEWLRGNEPQNPAMGRVDLNLSTERGKK